MVGFCCVEEHSRTPICLKTSGDWQNLRLLLDSYETSVGRVGIKNLNDMKKKKHGKNTKHTPLPILLIQSPTLTFITSLQLDTLALYNKSHEWPKILKTQI